MVKNRAIVIDIDGVILDSYPILEEMLHLKLTGDEKWRYFHEHCNGPKVTFIGDKLLPLLNVLKSSVYIILSTARNELCRESTEARLKKESFPYDFLYMRKENDYRLSPDVKEDHLNEILKSFKIVAFIDDDLSNCEAIHKKGILALRKI